LDQAVHQVVDLLRSHVLQRLLDALGLLRIEHLALLERALQRVLQIFQRVLIPLAEAHVLVLESAFEEEVRQRLEKILGADSEVIAGETRVVNPFHD
jgi:tryptophan 2,3-dioxygenase